VIKAIGVMNAAVLLLLLVTPVPSLAQGDKDNHEQGAKSDKQQTQAEPARHEEGAKPAMQEQKNQSRSATHEAQAVPQQQAKPVKPVKQDQQPEPEQHEQQAKSENRQAQPQQATQENHGSSAGRQHPQRSVAEQQRQRSEPALRLSARGNGRIPDDRFGSSFGRGHEFRMGNPTLVDGYSRFHYGGYWFRFVQPWPVGWYYTDDVYVDYIDGGYYLCNPSYPSARISISVVI